MADDEVLSAIFGADSFALVMSVFADRPGELLAAGEVERLSGVKSRDTLYKAINRGIRGGLLLRRTFGRTGAYEINTRSPLYPEMKALLSKVTGVAYELQRVLSRHPGVKAAFVYGSAASGHDTFASDVDLFVSGEVDEQALVDDLHTIESDLGREINVLILSSELLRRRLDSGDPFLADVWRKPRIMLVGDEDSLPQPSVPEPNPYFHQEMAIPGAARTYSTVVVAAVTGKLDEVTEQALDLVEQWVRQVMPGARTERATPQVGWWQVLAPNETAASWQTWLYPGPVISVRALTPTTSQGPGSAAIVLRDLVELWLRTLRSVTGLMAELGCDTVQAGLTLNPYAAGGEPRLVDVDFVDLVAPTRGAAPGQIPPWDYASRPFDVRMPASEIVLPAVRSLLRQCSFRHLDDTIRSLRAILREQADR